MRAPLQILLVEDDEVDREMVRRLLDASDLRLELLHAHTGAEARAQLGDSHIDCMIVDYHLPDCTGVELIHSTRAELSDTPPVIMLTGAGDERIAVTAMKQGVYDYLAKNYTTSRELEKSIRGAIRRRSDAQRERDDAAQLARDAYTDALTGLGNRRFFDSAFARALAGCDAGKTLALTLLDLNGFKTVNDSLGHAAGDTVLRQVARRLEKAARAGDVVARLGGDEFAIIVQSDADPVSVKGLARRLREIVVAPIEVGPEQEVGVGVSVGSALAPADGTAADILMQIADQRMYDNKILRRQVPFPRDERERINDLRSYQILDTPPEQEFDEITRLARNALGVPVALISFVDDDRQWFKSRDGLDATETPREWAFCAHAILDDDVLVVPDATRDPRFAGNPLVTQDPAIRFYAGAPLITPSGNKLGTLCVIDSQPRELNDQQRLALIGLADMAMRQLNTRRAALETESA